MKKTFLIFLAYFLLLASYAHDFNIGRFNLTQTESSWYVQIQVDSDNIRAAIMAHCPNSYQQLDFNEQLTCYLIDNFSIESNQRQLDFELNCIEKENGFYYVTGNFLDLVPTEGIFIVQNTCLLNQIEKQSNILTISRADHDRSFRLHKQRQTTSFKL